MDTLQYMPNIPAAKSKRIVIIGGGFAGMKLTFKLANTGYQVVLIDKNNYHQFQPLFYQVATAGLAPGDISFPLRKAFKSEKNIHVRMTTVLEIHPDQNEISTLAGKLSYDYLVVAVGGDTNYFGNKNIQENAIPMKSVSEALFIRNKIIFNYEEALNIGDKYTRQALMSVVVVGGGPTGVELAGALAEMKRFVLPKEYPTLDFSQMNVYLLEAGNKLLNGMSDKASKMALRFLEELGVKVFLHTAVQDYDGINILLADGSKLQSTTLLWAAGIKANFIPGLGDNIIGRSGRWKVNEFNKVEGYDNIFAIGDLAIISTEEFPNGHPQVAQVAIQQATVLANNLKSELKKKSWKPYKYHDKGSMATIGKKLAVVDLPFIKFQGFIAWLVWLFVHLMAIVGVKNKLNVFMNWAWNYLSLDPSLRLLIRPKPVRQEKEGSPWK
ncbi:MAG: NAD(P)/FAD-dependent oxidoreductase [Saprospiraceae bacterium]|nr:NAD(P)/FAD-dependent oxidoreductase [Saprospiraceae bacterium]MBK8079016.1 NAD(P)/FAD-dependent oxidoreductase [Saprospiraceae bacterium]MBK8372069.1 NAD(P)/FAD-dependent oxidoreductase [Saprospiraceae bacterium]MBK8547338.1 NAD(P)/FAD-dependent oxidoreductase [Saprospiraceae bacterium]MBK8818550.1 NAD(P)/FAD-dependent oxidoreductase [Saprospiraceae bacterium]